MKINLHVKNGFKKTFKRLDSYLDISSESFLDPYGQQGVRLLAENTPKDSGLTASSWNYTIKKNKNSYTIVWFNGNENEGINIALMIQYGHGTGTGGYVEGYDYINPSIRPVFDKLAEDIKRKVGRI